jgi:hypothetical protein
MLGIFWYWASAVIGDDGDGDRTPTTVSSIVMTATAPVATNTPEVNLTADNVTVEPTDDPGGGGNQTENDDPTETPEESDEETPEPAGKGFAKGDFVVTNSGDVNMRAEPSRDAEVVRVLEEGEQLEVTEPATEEGEGGYFWVGVQVGDEEGYVADDFLVASDE